MLNLPSSYRKLPPPDAKYWNHARLVGPPEYSVELQSLPAKHEVPVQEVNNSEGRLVTMLGVPDTQTESLAAGPISHMAGKYQSVKPPMRALQRPDAYCVNGVGAAPPAVLFAL